MIGATFLFALMAVCIKFLAPLYGAGEMVFYRSLIGLVLMGGFMRWRGTPWATRVPAMHFWRSLSGTVAMCLWFYALGSLPLATAMTLNYLSSVWIALFLIGGAVLLAADEAPDWRLVAAVLVGFAGVAMVLRPTIADDQLWHGLAGLGSGLLGAIAYLQVTALGRAGEPGTRVVLYFSVAGVVIGGALAASTGWHAHTAPGVALLLAIGLLATVAQWLMTRAYATGATLGIAALQYLGIVFSALFGALVFGDRITWLGGGGMALIVAAGVVATLLRGQRLERDDAPPTQT